MWINEKIIGEIKRESEYKLTFPTIMQTFV